MLATLTFNFKLGNLPNCPGETFAQAEIDLSQEQIDKLTKLQATSLREELEFVESDFNLANWVPPEQKLQSGAILVSHVHGLAMNAVHHDLQGTVLQSDWIKCGMAIQTKITETSSNDAIKQGDQEKEQENELLSV